MAKKRKLNVGRLVLIILICILIVLLVAAGVFGLARLVSNLFDNNSSNTTNNNNNNQQVIIDGNGDDQVNSENVEITLKNYKVYEDDTDKLGFNFVIAEMKFEADNFVRFDLNKLQTSEKINLGDVSKYKEKLIENGYNINKLNTVTKIDSQESSYTCYIFIPYTTDSINLGVYNLLDAKRIDINVTKNTNYVTSLKIDSDDQIIIDDTSINVSGCYQSDLMTHNGEPYYYPNSIKIFTFTLNVNSVSLNSNKIVSAKFVADGYDTAFEAMSEGYRDLSIDNIIGKTLNANDKYALFFEVYSNDDISYDGKLIIKFENNDNLVELSTTLQ